MEGAFGADVDYAQLVKIYGVSPESMKGRYSPAECTGIRKQRVEGKPDPAHVSTSYVEPQPHHVDAHAPVHATDQRVQHKGAEPRTHAGGLFHLLKLRPHPQGAARDAHDARWPH